MTCSLNATILLFLIAAWCPVSLIAQDASPLVPQKADTPKVRPKFVRTPPSYYQEGMRLEMDLEGKGKPETLIAKTFVAEGGKGAEYADLTLVREAASGKPETLWKYRHEHTVNFYVDTAPLDSKHPKKSFLVLNCAYGSRAGDLRVFQWDGKTFREVPHPGANFAFPIKLPDGKWCLQARTGVYGDEGDDLYVLEKGFMVPANYRYPSYYRTAIKGMQKELERYKGGQLQGNYLVVGARGLMPFLYAGKVKEGVEFYDALWRAHEELKLKGDVLAWDSYQFRAFAYLAEGREPEGLRELRNPRGVDRATEDWVYYSALARYHYLRNDHERALSYYRQAAKGKSPYSYERPIAYLEALLAAK